MAASRHRPANGSSDTYLGPPFGGFPTTTAEILRKIHGHDAVHVSEIGLRATDDAERAALAQAQQGTIVTENFADFAGERDVLLVFVLKRKLPAGGKQAAALADILDRWAHAYPGPYLRHHAGRRSSNTAAALLRRKLQSRLTRSCTPGSLPGLIRASRKSIAMWKRQRSHAAPEDLVRAVRAAGIVDARVLGAVCRTPRIEFVPAEYAVAAYRDEPIPIGHGQVTTQPSLSARMIEGLDLAGNEHVLEVGTGLGYQTALLARLAADVISIERWSDLVALAWRSLSGQGVSNVTLLVGDGSRGVPDSAPFDAIIVSAAHPDVPAPLVEQLRLGGRLVQPVGPGGREDVVAFHRSTTGLDRGRVLTTARFVRLHGQYGYPP